MTSPRPASLAATATTLTIHWDDGVVQELRWERLRAHCPCAFCRQERQQPEDLLRVLPPGSSEPIRAVRMEPLGNYAYHIDFSDGHRSGIYSFELLRTLGEAAS